MSRSRGPNPLQGFFKACALGGQPVDADLEAEGIPKEHWPAVRGMVAAIHAFRDDGAQGQARAQAVDAADKLLAKLGDSWAPPREGPDPVDEAKMTPAELAEQIPR